MALDTVPLLSAASGVGGRLLLDGLGTGISAMVGMHAATLGGSLLRQLPQGKQRGGLGVAVVRTAVVSPRDA